MARAHAGSSLSALKAGPGVEHSFRPAVSLHVSSHELVESHATRGDHIAGNAFRMVCRLLLQIVEHGASLRGARVRDGGDQFLLACPRRLRVSHGNADFDVISVRESASDLIDDGDERLSRGRFGRRVLADGAHRATSTAYADQYSERSQDDDCRIH